MSKTTTVTLKTQRYEFSNATMMQLGYFTKVHKFDERKAFKDAWKKWIATAEIAEMIAEETTLLESAGFKGDVEDKMFKAVRYYFRKKPIDADEPKTQSPRKKYVGFTGKILTAMDTHIINQIKGNMLQQTSVTESDAVKKPKYQCNILPDKMFTDFYNTQTDVINEEMDLLLSTDEMDEDAINHKIKKTYKNRYQTIRKKLHEGIGK